MKMLIIEDDKNILSVLKRGFEEENYIIDTSDNGEEGEYLAVTNSYDIILLDWMLPNKNGLEIFKITSPLRTSYSTYYERFN